MEDLRNCRFFFSLWLWYLLVTVWWWETTWLKLVIRTEARLIWCVHLFGELRTFSWEFCIPTAHCSFLAEYCEQAYSNFFLWMGNLSPSQKPDPSTCFGLGMLTWSCVTLLSSGLYFFGKFAVQRPSPVWHTTPVELGILHSYSALVLPRMV